MAGPASQRRIDLFIPPGESTVQYPIDSLAREIVNMVYTDEGTLASVRGPAPIEPVRPGDQTPARLSVDVQSVFHARLRAGGAEVDFLLARWGGYLHWHNGWTRSYQTVPLFGPPAGSDVISSERRSVYPDQYVVLNNRVIWTNGVDRARVITYEGVSFPLGFNSVPPAPRASGPSERGGLSTQSYSVDELTIANNGDDSIAEIQNEPNGFGYSWPGTIGTVGDVLDGFTGAVMAGEWLYWAQLESFQGDFGPLSPPSNPVTLRTSTASPPRVNKPSLAPQLFKAGSTSTDTLQPMNASESDNTQLDDLLKQVFVTLDGEQAPNTKAIHLWRSADRRNGGAEPQRVARIPGRRATNVPDNTADAYLGSDVVVRPVPVPVFRVACAHQGRLVIGNTPDDPGLVRRSLPGRSGTFPEDEYVYPDSGGAEVTAVYSHQGMLLAFTEDCVYDISDFGFPRVLSQGIGCVAPRSLAATPDGTLMWLGRDGFYAMRGGAIELLSQAIDRLVRGFTNRARRRSAVACYNYQAREYQCSLAPAGSSKNTLTLCFGRDGWRERRLGLDIRDMVTTQDARKYTYLAAREESDPATNDIYVSDRETRAYTPPARSVKYRSNWMRGSQTAAVPVHARTMYIGMLDDYDGPLTVRLYKNGSWDPVREMTDLLSVGVDRGTTIVTQAAGKAVVGTAKTLDPRLVWRQVPMHLEDARLWAFELEVAHPGRMHLAAIAFDISVATKGNSLAGRTDHRGDT